jgi:sterol 14-demethylase
MYTSSACLIGPPFREELTPEFARRYFELELGTDGIGYLNSKVDIASFRARDRARERLTELVSGIMERRLAMAEPPRDLLGVLLSRKDGDRPLYPPSVVAGILISTMFAGHHTSAGTAAWTLVELLRAPAYLARVVEELDKLYADGRDVSYQALREIPALENAVKETLRLHPPLIWLPRTALGDFAYGDYLVPQGSIVAVAPATSNRDPACFADPERFDPDRFAPPREEDARHPWAYVPFGGGRHRCLGANFAAMQQKAIFSVLLRRYEFALVDPPGSYVDDYSAMVVRPKQPFRVCYARRVAAA